MLAALRLPPGMAHAGTVYSTRNRYFQGSLVRFLDGTIRPIGGWAALASASTPATPIVRGSDTFTEVGGADISLSAHIADVLFGTWEYGGAVNTWQVEVGTGQQRTYRANATGAPAGDRVRCTNNIVIPAGHALDVTVALQRGGVDASGNGGIWILNNGALGLTITDGIFILFQRVNASTVTPNVSVWKNGVNQSSVSLAPVTWLANAAPPLDEKLVVIHYEHPTLDITLDGLPLAPVTIPLDMSQNGARFGFYSELFGSSGWRYSSIEVQTTATSAPGVTVVTSGKPRAAVSWLATTGGQGYFAVGHTHGLLLYSEGVVTDITPVPFPFGLDDSVRTNVTATRPYGSRFYGLETYGSGQPLQSRLLPADTWTLDVKGIDAMLVGIMADTSGRLYIYRPGIDTIAVEVVGAPLNNKSVVVTPESFVTLLGAGGDPRLVHWADPTKFDNDPLDPGAWDITDINAAAGDYTLETSGQLVTGRRGRGETVLWTDKDVYAMQFVGGNDVYRFEKRGFQCGLVGPNAVAQADALFLWMGDRAFHQYDGFARQLPCEVSDFVFSDFNYEQRVKVVAVCNPTFGEVTWYYPSDSQRQLNPLATENDRYVTFNYREGHWVTGLLPRACGCEGGNGFPNPLLCAPDGTVYEHEKGLIDPLSNGGLSPYLESGPVEVGEGDRWMHVLQLVPDERNLGSVQARFFTADYPTDDPPTVPPERAHGPFVLTRSTDLRLNARAMRVRIDQAAPSDWRVGTFRFDLRPGERR